MILSRHASDLDLSPPWRGSQAVLVLDGHSATAATLGTAIDYPGLHWAGAHPRSMPVSVEHDSGAPDSVAVPPLWHRFTRFYAFEHFRSIVATPVTP